MGIYYEDSLWDYYEEFFEEWKRIFVPITAIWIYDPEGTLIEGLTYEYDDSKRMVLETFIAIHNRRNEYRVNYYYQYDDDDWAVTRSTGWHATNIYEDGSWYEYTTGRLAIAGYFYTGYTYKVTADPYEYILDEDVISKSEYGASSEGWDYMEITYDDRGLVTRIDCYYEDGSSSGYALLEYGEQ